MYSANGSKRATPAQAVCNIVADRQKLICLALLTATLLDTKGVMKTHMLARLNQLTLLVGTKGCLIRVLQCADSCSLHLILGCQACSRYELASLPLQTAALLHS